MSDGAKLEGRCLCGSVQFSAKPVNDEMGACHCSMCRRWSGGVFLCVDCGDSLEITKGDDLGFYGSSAWGERGFCKVCGSTLMWRMQDGSHNVVSVQAFENPSQFRFTTEIYIDCKPDSYAFANDTSKMTEAEFLAAFASTQDAENG
ncbi:GFA family protein [Pseudochrobactrum algeriensis]|uniref:GFA family protein n=1 Tax=Pseudochrobactrum algeriensis TaxID=2834768 RepID=UPI001BD01832|nr:GFA family protein [Pseudochrobactrum algeriensis]MBX8811555.1 GFA family protein [Ochrobactrum sp. MR34]QVQ37876.1 GFA family protein [Pseudochrobactrum algeriensis]QVQ41099.1 GFA family protein [Pseudochrobactrum algeriensis]QVQ45022.1 GFA family protein [Pseudochrobactrum algeriensis]